LKGNLVVIIGVQNMAPSLYGVFIEIIFTGVERSVVGRISLLPVVVGGLSDSGGGGSTSSAAVNEPGRAESKHRQRDNGR